jgi:hypothetical protein
MPFEHPAQAESRRRGSPSRRARRDHSGGLPRSRRCCRRVGAGIGRCEAVNEAPCRRRLAGRRRDRATRGPACGRPGAANEIDQTPRHARTQCDSPRASLEPSVRLPRSPRHRIWTASGSVAARSTTRYIVAKDPATNTTWRGSDRLVDVTAIIRRSPRPPLSTGTIHSSSSARRGWLRSSAVRRIEFPSGAAIRGREPAPSAPPRQYFIDASLESARFIPNYMKRVRYAQRDRQGTASSGPFER